MNKYFHEDVHDENMDIAEKIKNDSEHIEIPKHPSFEELLDAAKNSKKTFEESSDVAGNSKKTSGKSTIKTYRKFSRIAVIAACFLTVVVVGGMFLRFIPLQNKNSQTDTNTSDRANPRIAKSYEDIYQVFQENDQKNFTGNYSYLMYKSNEMVDFADADTGANMGSKAPKSAASDKEFSKTNVQTENIDEADTIRTNGKYIFTFRETTDDYAKEIVISKPDGDSAKTVSTIHISDSDIDEEFNGMYVFEDRLAVITTKSFTNRLMDYLSDSYGYEQQTIIYIYDISNADKPALLNTNTQDGAFVSSRMKGSYLYTISNKTFSGGFIVYTDGCIPKVNGKKESCGCIYIPEDISSKGFVTVTSLDIMDCDDYKNSFSVVGDANQLYASNDNLYIINNTYDYMDLKDSENPFKNKKITKSPYNDYDSYIYERIEDRYPDVDSKDITKKVKRRDVRNVSTIDIMKFSYDDGNIDYVAESTTEGQAYDNMFFDEKDGYLRFVATHHEEYEAGFLYEYYSKDGNLLYSYFLSEDYKTGKNDNTSKVVVLNQSLNLCGLIEGLAKDEEIYSARYLGDYGYFVTFEQTDPLFTIDFSDIEIRKSLLN